MFRPFYFDTDFLDIIKLFSKSLIALYNDIKYLNDP